MNILLALASKHGSTRELAEAVAEELRKFEHTVTVRAVETVSYTVGAPRPRHGASPGQIYTALNLRRS